MRYPLKPRTFVLAVTATALFSACSSDSIDKGTLSVAITDAPVDEVSEVVVEFTAITIQPADGDAIEFVFDAPKSIDLLSLTDGTVDYLIEDESLNAGEYRSMRLAVNAEFDDVFDSYVIMADGRQLELRVPSGAQSGLKINKPFTVTSNGESSFVLDWDLRRSLTDPQGQPGLKLNPVLRIIDMAQFGTLAGSVATSLVESTACTNDLAADTGNAVYIFAGLDQAADDASGGASDPVATATVSQAQDGSYGYSATFLSPGDYSVAFTCQASDDDPEVDETIEFTDGGNVAISNGETTTLDFAAPTT